MQMKKYTHLIIHNVTLQWNGAECNNFWIFATYSLVPMVLKASTKDIQSMLCEFVRVLAAQIISH